MIQKTGRVDLPKGKKIALNLGFDFDSSSVWMETFQKTSQAYMARGEFGALVGVPRVLDLLDKYKIKSTFFIPGHTVDTFMDVCKEIVARGHEVAHHGYVHEDPTNLPYDKEEAIMVRGLESLDKIGVKPVGYRSPGFDFGPNTAAILEKYGIKYDSSLMGNDYYPYCPRYCTVNFDKGNEFSEPSKVIEMPVSWYLDDFPHEEFVMTRSGMKPPSQIYEIWKSHFDYGHMNTENGLMSVAMHPQVIGRSHMIMMLEQLINYVLENDAWIAPFKDIYDKIEFV